MENNKIPQKKKKKEKTKNRTSDPATPPLGLYLKEIELLYQKESCTPMLIIVYSQ
jgi:hypothetical protein